MTSGAFCQGQEASIKRLNTHSMIPFIQHSLKKQVDRGRKQDHGSEGLDVKVQFLGKGTAERNFWHVRTVLYFDCGSEYTNVVFL